MQIRYIRDYLSGSFNKFTSPNTIDNHNSTLNTTSYTDVKNWVQIKAITNENIKLLAISGDYSRQLPAEIWINDTQININWTVARGHALVIFGSDNKTPVFNQSYDTYSSADQCNSLATKINLLRTSYPNNYWAIVSTDSIGMNLWLSIALSDIGVSQYNQTNDRYVFAAVGYGGECLASELNQLYTINGNYSVRAEIFINGKNAAKNVSAKAYNGTSIPRIVNGNSHMSSTSDCYSVQNSGAAYVQIDLGSLIDIEYIHVWFGYLQISQNYHFNNGAAERWLYKKHRLDVSVDGTTWITIQNNENPIFGSPNGRRYYLQNPTAVGNKISNTPILQILSTVNENLFSTNETPKVALKSVYSPHLKNTREHLNKIINSFSLKSTGLTTSFIDDSGSSGHGKYQKSDIDKLNEIAIKFSNEVYTCSSGCTAACVTSCSSVCTDTCGTGTCGYTCSHACGKDCWNTCGTTACSGSCGGDTCSNTCGLSTCKHSCGTSCTALCGSGCSGTCGTTCVDYCSNGCSGSCYGGLNIFLRTCSSKNCTASCGGSCGVGCNSGCSWACTAACAGGCHSACGGDTCNAACKGRCATNCAGTWCTALCTSGCAAQCAGSICKSTCGGGCGSLCSVICSSSCSSQCTEDCSRNCSNGCTYHCAHELNA